MVSTRQSSVHKVLEIRHLTDSCFICRFERNNISFHPGQHISVGPKTDVHMREYSIYSAPHDEYLEILVKEIPSGLVSRQLKKLTTSDAVVVEGPFGFFSLEKELHNAPLFFIATGTGIAPFHCFVQSYPNLHYLLLHGIRSTDEQYESHIYHPQKYIPCISRGDGAHGFHGRVSEYIIQNPPPKDAHFFLCGNCDMIYEVYDILQSYHIDADRIQAEVYF